MISTASVTTTSRNDGAEVRAPERLSKKQFTLVDGGLGAVTRPEPRTIDSTESMSGRLVDPGPYDRIGAAASDPV